MTTTTIYRIHADRSPKQLQVGDNVTSPALGFVRDVERKRNGEWLAHLASGRVLDVAKLHDDGALYTFERAIPGTTSKDMA